MDKYDLVYKFLKIRKKLQNYLKKNRYTNELFVIIPAKKARDKEMKPQFREEIENILKQEKFPLFQLIEIETINRCNGECEFCPINRHDDTRQYKKMDEELFKSIIAQLKELNYDGRTCLFSNNEPLMDKRMFDFVEYAYKELPNSHFSFFTNGTLLNLERFERLIPYCDTFCIDIYHNNNYKDNIPENIMPIINLCLEKPELQEKVKIQIINRKAIRNNRGGKSKNRKFLYKVQSPCLLPYKQVIIRPDGKLSLCCNDATGCFTMGDLTKDKLIDIWNGKIYNDIRQKLRYKRDTIGMCEYCDNFGGTGTNASKDFVFTKAEFKESWEKVKKQINKNNEV